jgi:hypothetical protein
MNKTLGISLICFLEFGFTKRSDGQNIISLEISKIEKQIDSSFHSIIKAAKNLDYDTLSKGVDDRYNSGIN